MRRELPIRISKQDAHNLLKENGVMVKDMTLLRKQGRFSKHRTLIADGSSILRVCYAYDQEVEYYICPPEEFI